MLSARVRRLAAVVSSLPLARAHGRALRWALAVLATLVSVVAVAAASVGGHHGRASAAVVPAAAPQALLAPLAGGPPVAGRMYRIVGCRSHGSSDYTHGPGRYRVAIGFDDGPDADTPAFVDMLARNHAQATFFMIGRQVTSTYGPTIMRELREGDVPGDHTFTHPDLTRTGDVRGQLQSTISAIRAQSGYTPCVFRPPYGAYNDSVVRTARSLGLATVTWNVDPSDYLQPGTATIVRRVLAQVRPGSIIISHDGGGPRGQTLAAYPRIISALRHRGYGIVTIPKLLGFHPVYEPCVLLCDGIGVSRRDLPRDAIIQRAP
jgi:peptidoglycan/xylan/chitin deacetylase (PgdA/CDA1 family)